MSAMQSTLDIPRRLAEAMSELAVQGTARHSVAIVVPLRKGTKEVAEEFLAEGPPFAPEALGLVRHEVFLTEEEAIFVFETEGCLECLDKILADPDFWTVAPAWEHLADGAPRVATIAYVWPERHRT